MESEITDLFADKLALARRAHVSTSLRRLRSDFAHHVFVSTVALFIREARADPQRFAANLKTAEIRASKAKRTEVLALRLATNDPAYRDPKAANAAAYLACPPNGDPPPPTVRACVRYIRQTQNGLRGLSDLYAAAVAGETPEPPVLEEWAESQLDGIAPDLTFEHEAGDDVPLYTLSLTWCTDDEVHLWLLDPDDPKIRRAITQIKKRAITDNPKAWADASIVARYQRQAPPPAAPVDAQEALAAFVQEHLPGAVVSFEAVPVEPEAAPAKNEAATDRTAGYHGCLCCVGVMPPIHTSLSEAEALLRKSFEAGKTSGKKDGIEEVLASWERSKLVRIGKDETGIIHVQLWKNEEWVDEAYCPNIPDAICKAFEIVQLGVIEREQVPEPPPAEPEPEKAEVKAETPAPVAEPKTEVSVAEPVAALDPLAVLRHKLTNGDLDGVIHDGSVLIHGDAFGVLSPEPVAPRVVFVANPGREEVFVTRDGAESYLARTYPDKAIPIFEEPETNFALADCWVYDTRWHQPHKSKEPATRIAGEPHPAALPLTEPETPPETPPKRRGRPPGSKNKVKTAPFKSPFEPAPEPPPSPCCPECTKSYTLFGHRDGCGLEDPADMFGILPVPFAEAAE